MDAFVLPSQGGGDRGNDGSAIRTKPSSREGIAARRANGGGGGGSAGAVVVEKSDCTGKQSDNHGGDDNNEKSAEVRKFGFCLNNRGVNLSKQVKNRTGGGERGTSKLCPRQRGKFKVPVAVWLRAG